MGCGGEGARVSVVDAVFVTVVAANVSKRGGVSCVGGYSGDVASSIVAASREYFSMLLGGTESD